MRTGLLIAASFAAMLGASPSRAVEVVPDLPLPLPPAPPRVASGPDYDKCLGMLTTDAVAAARFAQAWEATGGGDGAAHCLALSRLAQGEAIEAAEQLQRLAGVTNASGAARAALYAQATQAWLLAGDPLRAYGSATLALVLVPDDVDLLVDRSVASATGGEYFSAIDDLNRAIDLAPSRADALVFRAAAWRLVDRLELAEDDIARAVALDPDNPEALLERGIIRQRRGDADGARDDWMRLLSLDPDSPTADYARQNLALQEASPAR